MTRFASRLVYFARTAARGLRGSPVTSAVAVVTIGVSLVLVGVFGLLLRNMEELIEEFGDELHVTAYLSADLGEEEQRALGEQVLGIQGVERVRRVTKEEALS